MRRLLFCTSGAATVETAIVVPFVFLPLTLGIADLGTAMFEKMAVNAAAQAGAAYVVFNSSTSVQTVMNDASQFDEQFLSNVSLCSASTSCTVSSSCPPNDPDPAATPMCVSVTATHQFNPLLPASLYSWAMPLTFTWTATIRIQ